MAAPSGVCSQMISRFTRERMVDVLLAAGR
jgi:hypothetical protein